MTEEAKSKGCCPKPVLERFRDGWRVRFGLLDFGPMPKKTAKQFYCAFEGLLAELADANEDIDFEKDRILFAQRA
jgi:hypothetical protein